MPQVTQQWPYGGPGSPYGSFAGKEPGSGGAGKSYTATFTRLGVHGAIARPYGSFAGKAEAPAPAPAAGGRAWPVEKAPKPRQRREREPLEAQQPAGLPAIGRLRRAALLGTAPAPEPVLDRQELAALLRSGQAPRPAPAVQTAPTPIDADTVGALDGKLLEADIQAAEIAARAVADAQATASAENLKDKNRRRRALLAALAVALED
jgi:hypothetical protein